MSSVDQVMNAGIEKGFIVKGEDDLFGKDKNLLYPLGDGPYYAIQCKTRVYSSLGGVEVDEHMRVLDQDKKVIPGLYAVGVDTIGNILDGVAYPDHLGIAFGWGLNSGRFAGEEAAAYVKQK